ncbi:concanavalin A-like lectin/glucanase domain-containing protein [Ilyonectria destructans]|nr:concanavalin A-like lectin/glucanase domain-containing protein [Ilyonectria destructans]
MPGQAATGGLTLPYPLCIIVLLALVFPAPLAAAAEGRYSNCSSFATNGSAASQFAYYRFYDFRNISSDTWDSIEEPKSPNNVTAGASTHDMSWQLDWVRRDGLRYPGPDVGADLLPIDYQPDKVHIAFVSSRQSETAHQSSGIDFNDESILHLSLRLYARITGAPGACTAFFTYENDTQEADIELLTRNKPDVVGFNTQPTLDIHGKFVPDSHWNMSFPNNITRDSWVNYRMDWVGDQVVWYVNGVHMANTSVNVPVEPSRLSIAMWGNGGTWTGNMTLGKSALLEVQWIEVVYNLSGTSPAENGYVGASVCNLDGEDDESGWQPYIFPPAHNSSSGGYEVGLWILLLHLAIILIM